MRARRTAVAHIHRRHRPVRELAALCRFSATQREPPTAHREISPTVNQLNTSVNQPVHGVLDSHSREPPTGDGFSPPMRRLRLTEKQADAAKTNQCAEILEFLAEILEFVAAKPTKPTICHLRRPALLRWPGR
ncbi:hypothetical protein TIFTF001_022689 [Ficus carica]|uniref:Uncharacterized protein n=1 Tax=Ficus carica TaxID=3494 RepID=A0AA88AZM7_FICCA|nr:hypothetical protein TIFTF001_022689 [Ficus carica]